MASAKPALGRCLQELGGDWQPFPGSQLGEQAVGGGEHVQLFGASQNTSPVVPPPWKPPKPRPQTERPNVTVHFGSCSNAGCGAPGPTPFPSPPLSTFPSPVLAAMKGKESLP